MPRRKPSIGLDEDHHSASTKTLIQPTSTHLWLCLPHSACHTSPVPHALTQTNTQGREREREGEGEREGARLRDRGRLFLATAMCVPGDCNLCSGRLQIFVFRATASCAPGDSNPDPFGSFWVRTCVFWALQISPLRGTKIQPYPLRGL